MARLVTWYPANGGAPVILTDRPRGYRLLQGSKGLEMPPYDYTEDDIPGVPGTSLREVHAVPRQISLRMLISGRTRVEYRQRLAALCDALGPEDGQGELEIAEADGTRRRVRCLYVDGLPGEESPDTTGDGRWWRTQVEFRAFWPYWYDAEPVRLSWGTSSSSPFFPILPVHLGASQVLGDTEIVNAGSVETPGLWRVTSPWSTFLMRRNDTGEQLALNGPVAAGRVLTINTDPEATALVFDDGEEAWDLRVDGSVFWQIPRGRTPISLILGDGSAESKVELEYRPMHRLPA